MSDEQKISIDASQRAVLEHGATTVTCYTVQEAKIEFDKLPPERKSVATMTIAGRKYSAAEIERFHYGPKPDVPADFMSPGGQTYVPAAPRASTKVPR